MYKTEFAEVSYNSDLNVVFVKWKKFCKGNDYRKPLLFAIDIMKKYINCNYVADTTDGFENDDEDTQWVFKEFIPQVSATTCKIIFFIIRPDNNLKAELEGQSVELKKYFRVCACYDFNEIKKILEKSSTET